MKPKKSKVLNQKYYWRRGATLGFKAGLIAGTILLLLSLSGYSQIAPILAYSIFYPYFIGVFYIAPLIIDPLCTEWCFHLIPLTILVSALVGIGVYTLIGLGIGIVISKIREKR